MAISNNSAAPSFASILSKSPDHVDRPKPLPVGTYLCTVGVPEQGKSTVKKTDFLKFPLKPIAALDDVDPEALEEVGGVEGKKLSITFYITEDAISMLDEFHQNCGIDLTDGTDRFTRNDAIVNSEVLAVVTHRIDDKDPERVYTDVRRTASAAG